MVKPTNGAVLSPYHWVRHIRIVSDDGCRYPVFGWGFGDLLRENSPLQASAKDLNFVWSVCSHPLQCLDACEALAIVASRDLRAPPLVHEVGAVMFEFAPRLQSASDDEKMCLYREIEVRWRQLLKNNLEQH